MIKWVIHKIRADVVVMVLLVMVILDMVHYGAVRLDLVLAINHLTSEHEITCIGYRHCQPRQAFEGLEQGQGNTSLTTGECSD